MSDKAADKHIQIDDTEFRNHVKATEFDKLRKKLEDLGFDVQNSTHADVTSLLDELVSTGPNAVALKAASEAIALKNQLQSQIKAFNEDMDKGRAEIYQIISNLKGITDLNQTVKDVDKLKNDVSSIQGKTWNLLGNESSAFLGLMRELTQHVDNQYLPSAESVKSSMTNVYLTQKSQELLRWLGLYVRRMERNENWSCY